MTQPRICCCTIPVITVIYMSYFTHYSVLYSTIVISVTIYRVIIRICDLFINKLAEFLFSNPYQTDLCLYFLCTLTCILGCAL